MTIMTNVTVSDLKAIFNANEEEIAPVEASQIEPGFEYLDAELEPAGASVVEVGVDFARKLRAHGDAAKRRPADKAFRDSLFDDS